IDIYRKQRPGEPPTRDAGEAMLNNLYFNAKRYDLAKVGRYKIGKKLGLEGTLSESTLRLQDVVAAIKYIVALHDGVSEYTSVDGKPVRVETDDIDHFGNRRIRAVGELIQNQVRTGLRSEEHTSELQSRFDIV